MKVFFLSPGLPPSSCHWLGEADKTDLKADLSAEPDEVLRGVSKPAYLRFHFSPDRIWRALRVVPWNFWTFWSVMMIATLSVRDVSNY